MPAFQKTRMSQYHERKTIDMVTRALTEDFVTLEELARIKGSTRDAVHKWMKRNPQLVDYRFVGNTIVVRLSSFDKYERRFK